MKPVKKKSDGSAGFTIIELMTVMSIIIILMGLLVPALNLVKRYAKRVTQKNQFHAIAVGLETFNAEWDGYPPSDALDAEKTPYCGAMKLAEAMIGQDTFGFHPDSRFVWRYPNRMEDPYYRTYRGDQSSRRRYLQAENANAHRLDEIYRDTGVFPRDARGCAFVLCDVYTQNMTTPDGKAVGMPVLYFKANTSGTEHPYTDQTGSTIGRVEAPDNIYHYEDNQDLVKLGKPWVPAGREDFRHPLDEYPILFYDATLNERVLESSGMGRPYNDDTYILMSGGFDGEYGTQDDVFNFMRQ